MGRLLLLCAALLSLVIGAGAEPKYVLSTPALLVSGDTGRACINIVESQERIDVSVVLEYNGRNTTIIAEDVSAPNYFQCGDFKVPTVLKAVPVAIIFSATGAKTDLRQRKSVVINPAKTSCMFQMDKPTYKPGQKVLFRLVCLDAQLKPVNQKFSAIYLQDPSRTKIVQWLLPQLNHGMVSLDFNLISDAPLGSYIITAERESDYPLSQWITVEQYVLPRFKVDMVSPRTVSVVEKTVTFNVSAIYTFGEPVAGSVTVRYCTQPQYYGRQQNCFGEKGETCSDMIGELGPDGSYSGEIDLYSSVMRSTRGRSFNLDVTVTEAGTGIQVRESRYIWVTSQPASLRLDYDSMNQYYKRNIDYPVVAQLVDENDQPMAGQEIEIQVENGEPAKAITDSDGRVVYNIDTSKMVVANFTVRVSYPNPDQCYFSEWSDRDYPSVEYTVYRFYSYSGSFLQMTRPKGEIACVQSHGIDVSYIISPEGTGVGVNTATIYYLVLSKSLIVQNGQKDIDLSSARNGSFSLDVMVSPAMAPRADLIVYSILEGEMIADTISLDIEKCFQNQVFMTFSAERGTPGSTVDVQLSADPNSYCALRVIDSSLLILNPYEQFSADTVYNSRRYYYYGYNVAGFNVEDPAPPCEDPDKLVFYNGSYYRAVSSPTEGDTYSKLKLVGLVIGTDLRLRKPEVCDNNPSPPHIVPLANEMAGGVNAKFASLDASPGGASRAASIEFVRTNFSETFMWVIVPLDTEGRATLSETVPDTITKWLGTAFCTSEETGFGMTKYSANYTTFLPFFMELSLPYSFIRGETLVLIGVVRNYMEQCVKVQVTLENTNAFTAELKDGQQDACICTDGRASYTWEVKANIIGELSFTVSAQTTHIGPCDGSNDPNQPPRKDTVVQTVIVEPEGINLEHTLSNLVFVNNNNVQLPVHITLPENVVPDSAKASMTAVGDLCGLPLRNLQDLVQKPYGCGEQNLARMAPIPPVLDYLNSTGQLTEDTYQKAKAYMTEGYYRHLSYTSGGAYRLFQNSIESVNSMLTAYSFKTFEKAKKYIYIDETRQQQTLIWLENAQRLDNGCFQSQGRLFTVQESETDRDLYYTAYVAIALLESDYSLGHTLLTGALECLKNASKSKQKIYDQAIMLYAFTLANLTEYSQPLLENLMSKAKVEAGTIHWEREDAPPRKAVPFFLPPYRSPELEVTAYILLSMAADPIVTKESLTKMAQVSMWLARQQNSHGGYVSTWDTVVVIQALASFAKLLYTPNSQQTVVVRKDNGDVATFNLNKDNRLVVQREALPETNGDYILDVSGTGWSMILTTVAYNIPVPKENSAFSLSILASSDNCVNGVAYSYNLNFKLSYNGAHNESNMAIVKARMLSGYSVDYSSVNKLVQDKIISKFELSPKGEVLLYMETVQKDQPVEFNMNALMGQRVLNVKSSSALVYRYYEEAENGYATYELSCMDSKKG